LGGSKAILPHDACGGGEVIETVYGKYSKYEVVKQPGGVFSSPKFYIYRDGEYHRGSFSSLRDAVEACKKEADKSR
jgi:hypothetical protein